MKRYQFARCKGNNSCKKYIILESSQECAKGLLMDKFCKCCVHINIREVYMESKTYKNNDNKFIYKMSVTTAHSYTSSDVVSQ